MSVDRYFARRYDARTYNCLHFACDVWRDETGEDLSGRLAGLLGEPEERRVRREHLRAFERLAEPRSPCLVLMHSPREAPHVGVFLRGKVLHLSAERGVEFAPVEVATRGFRTVRYFA